MPSRAGTRLVARVPPLAPESAASEPAASPQPPDPGEALGASGDGASDGAPKPTDREARPYTPWILVT
jgi:hypothetical protein